MRIDAHQHFWEYDPNEYPWINESLATLKRSFLPADLAPELVRHDLDGSIAVQARQSLRETEWLLQLSDVHDQILGVVGWVDLCSTQVEAQLQACAGHSKLVGVRHVVQDEPDNHFMLRRDFQSGISLLRQFDLTYDILIYPSQLEAALQLVSRFPDQAFVVDHLAKPVIRDGQQEPWKRHMLELARHENVCCKVSGMVTEADWRTWNQADFQPYLDLILEAFGPDRLMYGSDWPVCHLASDYGGVISIVKDWIAGLSAAEQSAIMGDTASRFYHISTAD